MGLFGFGKSASALPDLGALPVEQALGRLAALPAPQRNRAAATVLYSARARPPDLDDQIALFDGIADLPDLASHHRANARIARTHKALELGDATALSQGLPALLALASEIAEFPHSDDIRQDRCHVSFSRAYVGLNAALILGDGVLLASLLDEALGSARQHLDQPLSAGFYRSSANVMRCLAFSVISKRSEDASVSHVAQRVFARALEMRPTAERSKKARKVASGILMPDAEFMRTAALAQLLSLWQRADTASDVTDAIGELAVAQRTPEQRKRLLGAWQAHRQ